MISKATLLAFVIAGLIHIASAEVSRASEKDDLTKLKKVSLKVETKKMYSIDSSTNTEALSAMQLAYPLKAIDTYNISVSGGVKYNLTVAKYVDKHGINKQAIVNLPAKTDAKGKILAGEDKASQFRYEKWLSLSNAIKKYTSEQAIIISFWDNAQRVHLFTGRQNWVALPDQSAYSTEQERIMWKSIAGGFDKERKLAQYSKYLLMDMDSAITKLLKEQPEGKDVYLLMSTDDLSHIQEISILAGQGLPLETKLFPANSDLHDKISRVRQWAKEGNGTGSYLVQPISEHFIRAWRITDAAFEDTLLAQLLPFTSSLDKNKFSNKTKLVYQSGWGAYLSIYKLLK